MSASAEHDLLLATYPVLRVRDGRVVLVEADEPGHFGASPPDSLR